LLQKQIELENFAANLMETALHEAASIDSFAAMYKQWNTLHDKSIAETAPYRRQLHFLISAISHPDRLIKPEFVEILID
jgi:hypothetical protein